MLRCGVAEAVAGVCVVTTAVYAWPLLDPRLEWQFVQVWDDQENFIDNTVFRGLSLTHLRNIFSLVIINVWEPFGWLLKAIVYAIAGLDSRAYRIATLVFHLGAAWVLAHTAAILLAIVHGVNQFTRRTRPPTDSSDMRAAALDPRYHLQGCLLAALAFFVLHPMNVEVVAWPSAQPYALSAFFSVLALFFHSRRLQRVVITHLRANSPRAARGASPESESMPSDWDRLIALVTPSISDRDTQLSAVCFAAAVLSKSVCIPLPAVPVLIDALVVLPMGLAIRSRTGYFPALSQCAQYGVKYLMSKALLVCAAVVFVCATLTANVEGANANADIITLTLSQRVIKALSAPAWTMRSILWPTTLRPHYRLGEDEITLANPEYLLSAVALPLLTSWLASREPESRIPLLLAVGYFFTMLLPTCGLIQHGIVTKGADRYGYFPIMVLVPIGGHWLTRSLGLDAAATRESKRTVLEVRSTDRANATLKSEDKAQASFALACKRILYASVVVLLLTIDAQQMRVWKNSETHLEHSIRLDQADARLLHTAYNYKVQWGEGCSDDPQECTNLLNLAYHYAPSKSEKAKLYRYMILFLLDRRDLACEGFKIMKADYPDSAMIENNMAICALLNRHFEEARELITNAQKLTFYSKESQQSVSANYFNMVPWLEAELTGHGEQVSFDAKIVW